MTNLLAQEREGILYGCLGWVVILAIFLLIFVAVILVAVLKKKCPACKSRRLGPARKGAITVIAPTPGEAGGWALLRCGSCGRFVKTAITGKGSKYELALDNEVPPDLRA